MTKGKKKMNAVMNHSVSKRYPTADIKDLSKKVGVTINDILMSATSSAFKKYFKLKGDPIGDLKDGDKKSGLNVLMPANVRSEMYPTRESVVPENLFSALPLRMPLVSTMKKAYKPISKVTKSLKSEAAYVYSSFFLTYLTTIFAPRFIPRVVLHDASMKFTLAFSNTPGPVKPWYFINKLGEKCYAKWCNVCVCIAGRVGLSVCFISYGESLRIAITGDDAVCQDNQLIMDLIEDNLNSEMDNLKDFPVPVACYEAEKEVKVSA